MNGKKPREPLIYFGNSCPDWVTQNGFLWYGINLYKALDIENESTHCFGSKEKVNISYHTWFRRKKEVMPYLNSDRSMRYLNNDCFDDICNFTNVNVIIYTKVDCVATKLYTYGHNDSLETVLFHITKANFKNKNWSKLSLIYDEQVNSHKSKKYPNTVSRNTSRETKQRLWNVWLSFRKCLSMRFKI